VGSTADAPDKAAAAPATQAEADTIREGLDDLPRVIENLGLKGEVGTERHTGGAQLMGQRLGPLAVLGEVGHHAGALGHEGADDLAAEPARGPGHQHHPV